MAEQNGLTALIVGASRGLGLGLVRQHLARGWTVIATVRDPAAAEALHALGGRLEVETLDMNDRAQIAALAERLSGRQLDLLFVNAGVSHARDVSVGAISTEEFVRVLTTNTLAPLRVIEQLAPLVPAQGGVIAAMSSGLGSVSGNESGGLETYRASKAGLNMLLRSFAVRSGEGRTVLAVDPGWVRTDMGGDEAPLDVDTSTSGMTEMLIARRGSGGVAFVNYRNQPVAW